MKVKNIVTNERSEPCRLVCAGKNPFFPPPRASPSTLRLSKICPQDKFCLMANLLHILRPQRYGYQNLSYGQPLPHGKSITHSSLSSLRLSKICPSDRLWLMGSDSIHAWAIPKELFLIAGD